MIPCCTRLHFRQSLHFQCCPTWVANACKIQCREKADLHTAGVSQELAEREQCLRAQLEAAQTDAAAATHAHEAEVAELQQTLELRLATLRADVADWQVRAACTPVYSHEQSTLWCRLIHDSDTQQVMTKDVQAGTG